MPPLPERFDFPVQLLEEWATVPAQERIKAELTKRDIDQSLFGMLRSLEAQVALDGALVHWSNGQIEEANKALSEFRRLNVEAQNHVRQFYVALMISILQARRNAGG